MPGGTDVTLPLPTRLTVSVYGTSPNAAVTVRAPVMVVTHVPVMVRVLASKVASTVRAAVIATVHGAVPVQPPPDQPVTSR
jgi:hypothetical protein